MTDVPVRIGNCSCSCPLNNVDFFLENLAWFCFCDDAIYLGRDMEKLRGSEAILNHEYLHVVIYELEGRITTEEFDVLFDENNVIIGDDGTPTPSIG